MKYWSQAIIFFSTYMQNVHRFIPDNQLMDALFSFCKKVKLSNWPIVILWELLDKQFLVKCPLFGSVIRLSVVRCRAFNSSRSVHFASAIFRSSVKVVRLRALLHTLLRKLLGKSEFVLHHFVGVLKDVSHTLRRMSARSLLVGCRRGSFQVRSIEFS